MSNNKKMSCQTVMISSIYINGAGIYVFCGKANVSQIMQIFEIQKLLKYGYIQLADAIILMSQLWITQ